MKQVLQRLLSREEPNEKLQMMTTVFMILLFLAFLGASFYVLVNSFA